MGVSQRLHESGGDMTGPAVPIHEADGRTTMPVNDVQPALQVRIPLSEVEQFRSVLPWLLQALEERPNLTAKQRRRRLMTRSTLTALMARIDEGSSADPVIVSDEVGA